MVSYRYSRSFTQARLKVARRGDSASLDASRGRDHGRWSCCRHERACRSGGSSESKGSGNGNWLASREHKSLDGFVRFRRCRLWAKHGNPLITSPRNRRLHGSLELRDPVRRKHRRSLGVGFFDVPNLHLEPSRKRSDERWKCIVHSRRMAQGETARGTQRRIRKLEFKEVNALPNQIVVASNQFGIGIPALLRGENAGTRPLG